MVFMEKVQIVIDSIIKNSKSVSDATQRMKNLTNATRKFDSVLADSKLKDQDAAIRRAARRMDSFAGVMRMTIPQMQAFNEAGGKMQSRLGRIAMAIRKGTHGMKGFRMELLGVMFFGMMVANFFKALIRPAMDAFGVMDLWQTMLTVLFLPIMEALFPLFIKFIDFFMGLPEPVKLVIGVFSVLAIVLSTLVGMFGSIALGLGSLILVFGVTIGTIATFAAAFSAVFMGATLIISGFVMIFQRKMEGVGLIIMGVGAILFLFIGWWALIPVAVGAAVLAITKNWDVLKVYFFNFWNWMVGIFAAGWNKIKGLFSAFWNWISNTWVGKLVSNMWSAGKEMFQGMVNGIKSMAGAVKSAILGLFPRWARNLIWKAGKFIVSVFSSGDGDSGGSSGGNSTRRFNDMIWRPGQSPVAISPQDTLVATKGGPASGGGSPTFNTTNNINVIDKSALERMLDERDRKLMDNLRRLNTL
jgi:hypothetical protein